jgi:predicted glycoside hydrolase/deacetylase ChbG (UPF0249 family)
MCRIIINADDLGMSQRENHCICRALSANKITSASVMANGFAVPDALNAAHQFPNCSFGVHLNLTEFEPLTGGAGAKLLVDRDTGRMTLKTIVRARPSLALLRSIYDEWCAQISLMISKGVKVVHLNSHHHAHTLPHVFPALKAVQKRFKIRKVRISKNICNPLEPCSHLLSMKKRSYNLALRRLYATRTTDGFTDLLTFCQKTGRSQRYCGSVELMVHPDAEGYEQETELLYSDWEATLPFAIEKINYEQL